MKYHPLEQQAHQLSWKVLYKHLKKNQKLMNPITIDELIYLRGYQDFEFFASYFFPHHCRYAFSKMHQDFCLLESDPLKRGRRDVVAAPRGNAKTTFKVLLKALHAILYRYESFILVVGHSAPEAEQKIRDILDELENNERLIQVYGELAPVRGQRTGVGRRGQKWFITQNGIKVMAKSRGQQIRGIKYGSNRPTLILCDDIESPEAVLSQEQRQKARDWFYKDLLKCGQIDGTTNVTVIGTCLHPESLLSELLRAPSWESQKYQSIIRYAENQALWDTYKAFYTDLGDSQRKQRAEAFFLEHQAEMLLGTTVLWPEGESYLQLMQQLINEGQASFNSEKQNDPHDPDRQLFNMEAAKRFRAKYTGDQLDRIEWLDGSRVIQANEIQRIIAFHDPALGKKAGQYSEPDFAAIVVVAQDVYGFMYCLDAYIEKDPPGRQLEKALALYQKWGFETLYLEENHFQGLLKQSYHDLPGKKPWIIGVHQHENKYQRISTLEPYISNGHLLFSESLSPRLIDQLTLFPTGYDDGPDALEGAVRQLKKADISDLYTVL